jgi:dTDP-glucose pyrophosphorylase
MNIVIPMAGEGRRFAEAGYAAPKPMIPVLGKPMYAWAAESLPLQLARQLIFLVRANQLTEDFLADVDSRFAGRQVKLIPVEKLTGGQMSTVMLARDEIETEEGLLIHNADTGFHSRLGEMLPRLKPEVKGAVTVFRATDPRFSFARLNGRGDVVEVREKDPISCWATTGTYFFSHGNDFVRCSEEAMKMDLRIRGEFYVGPLYNLLVGRGGRVVADYATHVDCMGTPEELREFLERRG